MNLSPYICLVNKLKDKTKRFINYKNYYNYGSTLWTLPVQYEKQRW